MNTYITLACLLAALGLSQGNPVGGLGLGVPLLGPTIIKAPIIRHHISPIIRTVPIVRTVPLGLGGLGWGGLGLRGLGWGGYGRLGWGGHGGLGWGGYGGLGWGHGGHGWGRGYGKYYG